MEPRRLLRGQQRFARQLCDVMRAPASALMLDTSRTLPAVRAAVGGVVPGSVR
jgi:hypothetical protein